jgi:hypothetical protein
MCDLKDSAFSFMLLLSMTLEGEKRIGEADDLQEFNHQLERKSRGQRLVQSGGTDTTRWFNRSVRARVGWEW